MLPCAFFQFLFLLLCLFSLSLSRQAVQASIYAILTSPLRCIIFPQAGLNQAQPRTCINLRKRLSFLVCPAGPLQRSKQTRKWTTSKPWGIFIIIVGNPLARCTSRQLSSDCTNQLQMEAEGRPFTDPFCTTNLSRLSCRRSALLGRMASNHHYLNGFQPSHPYFY